MYDTKSYSIYKPWFKLLNLAQCMLQSLILSISQALAIEPRSIYATKSYSIYNLALAIEPCPMYATMSYSNYKPGSSY